MPATVETDPPGIWCMFSDGSTASFSLDVLSCPGLAGDLLTAWPAWSTRTAASTPRERPASISGRSAR
jgi:hypothetical protein